MSANKSSHSQIIEKKFNCYKIRIITFKDSITISVQKNDYLIYENDFKKEKFQSLGYLNNTIKEINDFLLRSLNNKKIDIKENKTNIQFILILEKNQNIELILNKKNILSKEIIEKLIKEIEILKENNNKMRNDFTSLLKIYKEKIKDLEIQILDYNNKINEMEQKIKNLETHNKRQNEIDYKKFECSYFKLINIIKVHSERINCLSTFPSGNLISGSNDKSIKIFDKNFNVIQNISNAHNDNIYYINIKDENNFVSCSIDQSIKTWIKKEKEFILNQNIINAHDDYIYKVIYFKKENLISCSEDKKIKIWEKINNNKYQINTILTHSEYVYSILLLEDKNILISSAGDGTKFWNSLNFICFCKINDACGGRNSLCLIDDDKIILQGKYPNQNLKLISLTQKKVIKEINNNFHTWGLCYVKSKGIILVGGRSKNIIILDKDNLNCIDIVKEAHENDINGFTLLDNDNIASFSWDKTIKIWKLKNK